MKYLSRLLATLTLVFVSTISFAGNNNNPVDCPPISMIANTKFTLASQLFPPKTWVLFSRLNFKQNENWALAYITNLDLNNQTNEQEAVIKGQEKFQTLSLDLTNSGNNGNKSYCFYYQSQEVEIVVAMNNMDSLPAIATTLKKLI